jgi:hypothetical protein
MKFEISEVDSDEVVGAKAGVVGTDGSVLVLSPGLANFGL